MTVLSWMLQQVQDAGSDFRISAKAVSHPPFRHIFHETDERSRRNNRMKAQRWWKNRNEYIQKTSLEQDSQLCVTSRVKGNNFRLRCNLKAMSGRGWKLRPWVQYVRGFVADEFERMWNIGAKITYSMLLEIARYAVNQPGSLFPGNFVCLISNRTMLDQIDRNFVERFCGATDIVRRINSGNKKRSAEFSDRTEKKLSTISVF